MARRGEDVFLTPNPELTELHRKIAKKELHENAEHTAAHITSLRRWITSMKHLEYPDDDRVYCAFLRHAKYEHSVAQARMDNFATLRTSEKCNTSKWFILPPISDPVVERYLNAGFHIPVGFLNDGTFLFIVRPAALDKENLPVEIALKFVTFHMDRIFEDPRVQICGIRLFLDMTDVSSKLMQKLNPTRNFKEIIKMFQEGYPARIKTFIYYNEPLWMDQLLKILFTWMKPKLRERIIRSKSDITKAFAKVYGLQAILPREYGGDNRSINDIITERNAWFRKQYNKPTIWTGIKVNESKRPESAKHYLKEYKEYSEHSMGHMGTYVQLPQSD
ncbi:Alpha-tocopherol transfer protein-like [Clonorchis sinensis]|uniref:Alpha-tocopherol transfer protein-like n=2 Tax=Clonorchis sinensis TaxID=79923 RepID=H2KU81_CLOSI|nr:Alpha-tocopherol transfer protein-like [Clonorchis sinensis]GAA36866.2 alpha-tocopherol transfer protein-like [Clonorchis sinensis]